MRRALLIVLAASFGSAWNCAPESSSRPASNEPVSPAPASTQAGPATSPILGSGFVVWESNRTGDWRIWRRALGPPEPGQSQSETEQLTPDVAGSQHCCPHVSPDGRWIAYLSLPQASVGYGKDGIQGSLHLIRPNGSEARTLAESARSSWENRAVVWRSPSELIYIRGDGATVLHNLDTNRIRLLTNGSADKTWLVNSLLSHAVSGIADFSPYKPSQQAVTPRRTYGGCQPYFSHDGRWGFWAAGAGGPIHRIELATNEVSTVLSKSDPRLPEGLGYAYFPMFSRDGRLFSFAASPDQHDHFAADYEIFVAESDPETLELLGKPVRMTSHPGTDRFPDVFLEELALGRHRGEAPLEIALRVPDATLDGDISWTFGDGGSESRGGARAKHTYERPGLYAVRAESPSGAALHGQVLVQEAAPPQVLDVRVLNEGRSVQVRFDEPIDPAVSSKNVRLESGANVSRVSVGNDRESSRTLVVHLADRLDEFNRLQVRGIRDRAQRPNLAPPRWLEIDAPLWPSDRSALAFLWETADAANLVWDPLLRAERASSVTPGGRAVLDRNFAMTLRGGRFVASTVDAESVVAAARRSNRFSLELVLRPEPTATSGPRRIVSLSSGNPRGRNFYLAQRGRSLVFNVLTAPASAGSSTELTIAEIPWNQASHLLISYEAGRLVAYLNGERVVETDDVQGGFFHWRKRPLLFGNSLRGDSAWHGQLEGVAIYGRALAADEARENYLRYRRQLTARDTSEGLRVEATLRARSPAPTLEEIAPYREALAVFQYQVDRVLAGSYSGDTLRVAHWAILDGNRLDVNQDPPLGSSVTLSLERYQDNRQLESTYLADTVPTTGGALFYSPLE